MLPGPCPRLHEIHVPPQQTAAERTSNVNRIADLGPGGGYVLAPVHNIQEDVPPENILAMADAALEFGGLGNHV